MGNYICEIVQHAGVRTGDTICVQSSLSNIGRRESSPDQIIEGLQESVGETGCVIMPAYNFHSWTEHALFHYHETKSEVGHLTEHFRKYKGVQRTKHPIHSLSVWGKHVEELIQIDTVNSFAHDSVFSKLFDLNIKYITLGTGLSMPFLPCHFTESRLGVGYRTMKLFAGQYVSREGVEESKNYGFEVKKEEFRTMISPVYEAHIDMHKSGTVSMETIHDTAICWSNAREYDEGFVNFMRRHKTLFKNG
jgi:aminoglycoside 3-N-acetyltransferase